MNTTFEIILDVFLVFTVCLGIKPIGNLVSNLSVDLCLCPDHLVGIYSAITACLLYITPS